MSNDQITANAEAIASRELAALLERTPKSKALFDRAVKSMPGGVASSFQLGDPYPIYLERGVGPEVWDVDGHQYYDFHNGFGTMAVGHANPIVADAIEKASRNGMHFAVTVERTRVARRGAVPPVQGATRCGSPTPAPSRP